MNFNEVYASLFENEKHTPIFRSMNLLDSLNGMSSDFQRRTENGVRIAVIEERLIVLKLLQNLWNNDLMPALADADFEHKSRDILASFRNVVTILQNLPLVTSSEEFNAYAQMFASHLEMEKEHNQKNGVIANQESFEELAGPVYPITDWNTSEPLLLFQDKAEEEYFKVALRTSRGAFAANIINDFPSVNAQADVFLKAYSALLKENVAFYQNSLDTLCQTGIRSTVEENIGYAFGKLNFSDDEMTAIKVLSMFGGGFDPYLGFIERMIAVQAPKNEKAKWDYVDEVIGLPSGTIYNMVKRKGPLDRAGWLQYTREPNPEMVEIFDKGAAKTIKTHVGSSEEFYALLTDDVIVPYKGVSPLTAEDFQHMGQDWRNLLSALQSDKPLKVLITGKSGNGKTALVDSALRETKREAVTLDSSDESNVTTEIIGLMRTGFETMGSPVFVVDPMEQVSGNLQNLFSSTASKNCKTTEIWVANDLKMIPPQAMTGFDLVIDVPTLPLSNRLKMAQALFDDTVLADKVAKCCSTPGEIAKLKEWSEISGQKDWNSLSLKAIAYQQATLKAGSSGETELPIQVFQPSENKYGFDSVVGNDHIVKEARKAIVGFKNPEKFSRLGATPPKGLLLTGSPGTGKTYLARAMAHEAGVPLITATSAALAEKPSLISSVFTEARRQAPCILFLDEIDAIGASAENKNGASADPERQAILNRLLVEINNISEIEGVMVLGATHRPEVLDPALIRSGRLGWGISFELPERLDRKNLWQFYCKGLELRDVSWDRLARLSVGMSPADISEAVKVAGMNAAIEDDTAIGMDKFIKAIDAIGWGVSGPERKVLENDLYETAVHETGHAVLAWAFGMDIDRISVKPDGGALGYVRHLPNEEKLSYSMSDTENKISMLLGGLVAEEVVLKKRSLGASSDLARVRSNVATMYRVEGAGSHAVGGVDWMSASEHLKMKVEEEEQTKIKEIKDRTTKIFQSHKAVIQTVAKILTRERELSGEELDKLLRSRGLTPADVISKGNVPAVKTNVQNTNDLIVCDPSNETTEPSVEEEPALAARKKHKPR